MGQADIRLGMTRGVSITEAAEKFCCGFHGTKIDGWRSVSKGGLENATPRLDRCADRSHSAAAGRACAIILHWKLRFRRIFRCVQFWPKLDSPCGTHDHATGSEQLRDARRAEGVRPHAAPVAPTLSSEPTRVIIWWRDNASPCWTPELPSVCPWWRLLARDAAAALR